MDIFSLLALCGGLAFFLYGMNVLSKSLEKMAGGKLKNLLERMTSNPLKSLLLGAGITVAIQSSSAVTVMLVGLVNSGVMQLHQTVGIIMGSNVGTTTTAWILSLAGIESDNIFLNLLKPENFSPMLALIGVILIMGSKKQRRRDIGRALVGFSILMYGMEIMKNAVAPLAEHEGFSSLMTAFENPILGLVFGAVFTAVIQSSAASVGILQALALSGSVNYGMAIPIIMGQNIGTCVTALLSSIGVNRNAKRVAVIHISFNVIGSIVCLTLFCVGDMIFHFSFADAPASAAGIALCHSIFNIFTTLLLLPISNLLVKIAEQLIKTDNKTEQFAFLDPLLMRTPSVAISECVSMCNRMGQLARQNLLLALEQLEEFRPDREIQINENEDKLDIYEDRLGTYLIDISQHGVSLDDIHTVSRLLHAIGDFERIGDHAQNIQDSARDLHDQNLHFSQSATAELDVLKAALRDILERTLTCFESDNAQWARNVEPLEETIDRIIEKIRLHHVRRLQSGECTMQLGVVLSDLLTNCERVSDHCSNVALSVIEEKIDADADHLGRHAYLNDLKADSDFTSSLERDLEKYRLPKSSKA